VSGQMIPSLTLFASEISSIVHYRVTSDMLNHVTIDSLCASDDLLRLKVLCYLETRTGDSDIVRVRQDLALVAIYRALAIKAASELIPPGPTSRKHNVLPRGEHSGGGLRQRSV
jgi:hypothetical protein